VQVEALSGVEGDRDVAFEQDESTVAGGAPTDPLIARSLEVPLSTGDEALFIIDSRHRLLAAAATNVDELEVYIGKPRSA
jgi:hypothetical protein